MRAAAQSSAKRHMWGGVNQRTSGQPHEPVVSISKKSALHGHLETDRNAVPSSRRAGLACMSFPRRARWRTEWEGQWRLPTRLFHEGGYRGAPPDLRTRPALPTNARCDLIGKPHNSLTWVWTPELPELLVLLPRYGQKKAEVRRLLHSDS